MVNVVRAEAVITAKNATRPGLRSTSADLERFRREQTKAMRAIERSTGAFRGMERMERAASVLRNSVTALSGGIAAGALIAQLKQATVRFSEVDRAMSRTGITGDATVEQTRKGAEELRNLARDAATLFDPAQKGLDAITASGRDFGDAMKMMPSVLKTAQASGAGVDDIANSSTSLLDHMKISIEGLAEAQDTLAMGGKLGKFELKDMARYLPSMLPAFKALGQSGQQGLRNLVAMLQVIRSGTGSAEEAASSAQNIFAKMESEQTVKNFKEFGIDLPKAMTKARKEGKDLIEAFLELSNQALKGDLSKLPKLFQDMEVQRGMRPLLAEMQKRIELIEKLKGAKGTIDKDSARISADSQASLDRFGEAADRAKTALGGLAAEAASPLIKTGASNIDALAQAMERAAEAARDGGFLGAIKRIGGDFVDQVGKELADHNNGVVDLQRQVADEATIGGLRQRFEGANSRPSDPRERANIEGEIAEIEKRLEGEGPGRRRDLSQKRLAALRQRLSPAIKPVSVTDAELAAIARDQQRRAGGLDLPALTSSSAEFDQAREAAREARRASSWTSAPVEDSQPSIKSGQAQKGQVMPPQRPKTAFPSYAEDDVVANKAPAPSASPASSGAPSFLQEFFASLRRDLGNAIGMPRPVSAGDSDPANLGGVDLSGVKAQAGEVKGAVEAIGPAGQTAGSTMASGFSSGLSQMEAEANAAIARIQQKLNSLRAPSLSFGGAGGFDTGKQGPN